MVFYFGAISIIFLASNFQITQAYDNEQMKIKGDFTLGAIFPMRTYIGGKDCGELEPTFVLQAEAFRLSIDYVNRHVLHGYTFGGLIVDECDDAVIGLQSAVKLLAGEISDQSRGICSNFRKTNNNDNSTTIYGMTGGTNSIISERVSPLLEVFCLPLVSTYATAPLLDDVKTYSFFLRTVPSDVYQARAVYDVLQHMKWSPVFVIYEKTSYGSGLFDNFSHLVSQYANAANKYSSDYDSVICIANYVQISNENPEYGILLDQIQNSGANVIVLFVDFTTAKRLFKYIKSHQTFNPKNYQWVGTDGWGRTKASTEFEDVIKNAVTTEFYSYDMPLMSNFLTDLTFGQVANSTNPWLRELVQTDNNCTISTSDPFCSRFNLNQHVNLKNKDAGLGRSYYVFEAVYAFGLAFEELRKKYCPFSPANRENILCDEFYEYANGTQLLEELKQINLTDSDQLPHDFRFSNNSGLPHYSIFQLQSNMKGDYSWVPIGNWSLDNGEHVLKLIPPCHPSNSSDVESTNCMKSIDLNEKIVKNCHPQCPINQRRSKNGECCWSCEPCSSTLDIIRRSDDTCQPCPIGYKPDISYQECQLDNVTLYANSDWKMIFPAFVCLAITGVIASAIAFGILIWYRRTPAAILASFPLCATGTLAVLALFASTILTVLQPSDVVCVLQWSLQPFFLTLVIAAISAHALHLSRGFVENAFIVARYGCASVRTKQIIQLLIICLAETMIIVLHTLFHSNGKENLEKRKPNTSFVYMEKDPEHGTHTIACSSTMEMQTIFILFIIPFVLLLTTLVFGLRRYKSKKLYERRENRRIIWSCGLILILFVIVVTPIFATVTSPMPRAAVQIATLLLCGFIVLLLIYTPTIILMLRGGQRNTFLHLTRDAHEDERIKSDQLKLSDEILGEGHFCEVRRGTYRRGKKEIEIAAKMAKKHITVDLADLTDSLLQEIMILRHIRECEHVVRLFGVCNDADRTILVFEYVNGGNCRRFVPNRRTQLSNCDLLSIAANIVDALCFLKEKSIVHRDVKSENCLVQERMNVVQGNETGKNSNLSKYRAKLADFGVAVEANAGRVDGRRKRLFPERHTAPEGFTGNFSHESDVWSFGVFLWELFTLKSTDKAIPYANCLPDEDIGEHIAKGNILQKPPGAPSDVYENIMKPCWTYEPAGRIGVTVLKHLLVVRARKMSHERYGAVNGVRSREISLSNSSVIAPDIINGPVFWTKSVSQNNSEDGNDLNFTKAYYKKPVMRSDDVPQNSTQPLALTHQLQPSVIMINVDDEDERLEKDQDANALSTAAATYRKVL